MAKKDKGTMTGEPVTYQIPAPAGGVQMETFIPWTLVKRGVRRRVITPIDSPQQFQRESVVERVARKHAKDSPLIRALGLAYYWQGLLDEGKYRSLTEIAASEGIDLGRASRIVQLARIAPQIVQACLDGDSGGPKMVHLARACLSGRWADQKAILHSRALVHADPCKSKVSKLIEG